MFAYGLLYHIWSGIARLVNNSSKKSQKLLDIAKDKMIGRLALQYEGSADILDMAALELSVTGKILSFEEKVQKIKSVTIDQVQKVVDKYLSEDKLIKVMLMPK